MHRSRTAIGIAAFAAAATSTATFAAPAGAVTTDYTTIASGLKGPLQFDVEGSRTVVAQNFIGELDEVNPDGTLTKLAAQKNGEVAGVAINGDTVGFLSTRYSKTPASFLKVVDGTGAVRTVANLWDYEATNNPDGGVKYGFLGLSKSCKKKLPKNQPVRPYKGIVDSHPYGLADATDGSWYVADAAGNDILHVAADGTVSTVAVLPRQKAVVSKQAAKAFGFPRCVGGKTFAFEPVPTDVEIDGTGQLVVSLLPGGPEDPSLGARGSVVRVDPSTGDVTEVAKGFAGATNVAVAPSGSIRQRALRRPGHGDRLGRQHQRVLPGEAAGRSRVRQRSRLRDDQGDEPEGRGLAGDGQPACAVELTARSWGSSRGADPGSSRRRRCGGPGSCPRRC